MANSGHGGADRQLKLEAGAPTQCRLHRDAPAMHLYDLLVDGKAEPRAALGLAVGAVDLVKLFEDARLFLDRDAGPGVDHGDGEVAVLRPSGYSHLSHIGELDGIAHKVEKHLGEALLVA
jgi:hypothetical protein